MADAPAKKPHISKLQITMSHAMTTAAQGLSLAEKRVMMYAISKLDSFKSDGGTPTGVIKLSAHEYAEQFDVDPDTAYNQLKSAGKEIRKRCIRYFEDTRKGPQEVEINWVSKAVYHPGEGWISLRFTQDVAPHLLELKGKFTTYKLAQASALRSLYSWRLLEILSQYESTGWRQIDMAEFHHAMEATPKQRENFAAVRRKIIEPAVKELCEKDGWLIEWHPIKTGRKVTALRFQFQRDPQGRLL